MPRKRYSENQDIWLAWKKHTTQTLANDRLDDSVSFKSVFRHIAEQRAIVAYRLNHGKDSDRTNWFGKERTTKTSYELILRDPTKEQLFSSQCEAIFSRADAIFAAGNTDHTKVFDNYMIGNMIYPTHEDRVLGNSDVLEKDLISRDLNITRCVYQAAPPRDFAPNLFRPVTKRSDKTDSPITFQLFISRSTDDRTDDKLVMIYGLQMLEKPEEVYQEADILFQNAMAWKPEDGADALLLRLGHLAHHLILNLPVERGNASITEILVESICLQKGFEFKFNRGDQGLAWDFEAMLTPDQEEYAKLFVRNGLLNKLTAHAIDTVREDTQSTDLLDDLKEQADANFREINADRLEMFQEDYGQEAVAALMRLPFLARDKILSSDADALRYNELSTQRDLLNCSYADLIDLGPEKLRALTALCRNYFNSNNLVEKFGITIQQLAQASINNINYIINNQMCLTMLEKDLSTLENKGEVFLMYMPKLDSENLFNLLRAVGSNTELAKTLTSQDIIAIIDILPEFDCKGIDAKKLLSALKSNIASPKSSLPGGPS